MTITQEVEENPPQKKRDGGEKQIGFVPIFPLLGFSIFSIFLSIQPKGLSTPSTPPKFDEGKMRVCVTRTPRWPTDFGRVLFPLCPFVA